MLRWLDPVVSVRSTECIREDFYDINFEDGERKKKAPLVQIYGAPGDRVVRMEGERVKAKCEGGQIL